MAKTTFIVNVTGGEEGQEGVAELDSEASENFDAEGNLKSFFLLGEEAVFIVNSPPGYKVAGSNDILVHSKCGGGYLKPGTVRRDSKESAGFDSESLSTGLKYWPHNSPVVDLYTVPPTTMRYDLVNRTLSPVDGEELPVQALITYTAECQQVVYTPPAGLYLATSDDEFLIRIEIVITKS